MPKGQKANLSVADIEEIVNLYNSGKTQLYLANQYNISRQLIGKILKKNNVPIRKRTKITQEDKQLVIELYFKTYNQSEISNILHMDVHNIRTILHDAGIKTNDTICHRIYDIDDFYFDNIDTPNKAYILGLLCADGNISRNNGSWKLTLQERDKNILIDICNELKTSRPLLKQSVSEYYKKNQQDQYMLYIGNQHMHDKLIEYGLVPNKSLVLEYPSIISQELQRHFLRGYFDGDGSSYCGKNGKNCSFMGTASFCDSAKRIIKKELGINANVYSYKNSPQTSVLYISGGKQVFSFFSWIYKESDLKLQRKYEKFCKDYADKLNNSPLC